MDNILLAVLVIALISAVEYYGSFSDRAHNHMPGTPDPQPRPAPGTYTARNFTQYLMIMGGAAAIVAGLYYAITGALLDGVKPFNVASGSIMLVGGVVLVLRSVDRLVGERTQNLAAAIGAFPITSVSDYAATAEVNGVPLRFNITCTDQHGGRSGNLNRTDYTVNARCCAANVSGMRMEMYRHYAQLPLGLHPRLVSPGEWEPYKARCSSDESMPALSAVHAEAAAIAAANKLDLEYLCLKGNDLKARVSFEVHDEEDDMDDVLTISRVKAALELTAKAAAALR